LEEKLNIAIFVDDYLPLSTKVAAKMLGELAKEYLNQGDTVSVFVPDHRLNVSFLRSEVEGIHVVSFKSGNVKNRNKALRAINELSLSLNAWFRLKQYFYQNPHDLIIYYSPSIFFGPIVGYLKKVWGCKSYLILRDIFPG
jgi:hypothetical protein